MKRATWVIAFYAGLALLVLAAIDRLSFPASWKEFARLATVKGFSLVLAAIALAAVLLRLPWWMLMAVGAATLVATPAWGVTRTALRGRGRVGGSCPGGCEPSTLSPGWCICIGPVTPDGGGEWSWIEAT